MSSGLLSSTKYVYQRLTFRFKVLVIVLFALSLGALAYLLLPKPDLARYQTYSSAVFDRNGQLLRISLAEDERYRLYTPIDDISADFQQATILYEDQHYYAHSGVDYVALVRAFWQTYVLQQRRIGASTIVMQVARLRWNIPSNTLNGKVEQIFRALQLSRHYSKKELLEAYLNLAPYGGNIEGIGAASLIYFDKPASALSLAEALTLAVVPQNPNQRNPSKRDGMQALQASKQRLLARWIEHHPSDEEVAGLLNLPLSVRGTKELPHHAPHFVQFLMDKKRRLYTRVVEQDIALNSQLNTTLDLTLQLRLENVLQAYIEQNETQGFYNASALLLNHKSMEIEAMIGSADFYNRAIQGQVNGTLAKRSPGSTLKPFVYALAIDAGLIHPMSMLKDLPKKYGGFAPENFGKGFVGPISAQDALIKSRNVPAVELQSQLLALQAEQMQTSSDARLKTFYEFLKHAGVSNLKSPQHYGLALALGGGELSMLELVELYSLMPNLGVHKSAVSAYWVSANKAPERTPNMLLSPEAAALTFAMLSHNPKPNQLNYGSLNLAQPDQVLAWKTGTSWAFRDAWAIGISGDYVLATWVGNFNGEGNNAFIGRTAAGPLLFQLLDVVKHAATEAPERVTNPELDLTQQPGLNIKRVDICKTTGDLFAPECPEKASTLFIPGVSPIKRTNIYRRIWVDKATGLRACDANHDNAYQQVFAFWPSDFLALFDKAGIHFERPPSFMPDCALTHRVTQGQAPNISSPQSQVDYIVEESQGTFASISLQASADGEVSYLYWFANGQFIGTTDLTDASDENSLQWHAKPGRYDVQVSDDFGRSSNVSVRVLAMN